MKSQYSPFLLPVVLLAMHAPAQQQPRRTPYGEAAVLPARFDDASSQDAASLPSGVPIDASDPLLQPPPLPKGKPTLIGGSVTKIDRVRQTVTLKPYGGGSLKVFFDERTHLFRGGVETTVLGIHRGDRVYVDTLEEGGHVLAKSIRVQTQSQMAEAQGQILAYNPNDGSLQLREELSSQPINIRVTRETVLRQPDRSASSADLLPGALVQVQFSPDAAGHRVARRVTVFAAPGSTVIFAGKITYLDMSRGTLALQNRSDSKNYEIHFNPAGPAYDDLSLGSEVSVSAVFDGQGYQARQMVIAESAKK